MPISRGGRYTLENVVPACASCNASKHNSEVTGWMREQGFGSYKLPESLRVVEAIPRNPVGKIDKRALVEEVTSAPPTSPPAG